MLTAHNLQNVTRSTYTSVCLLTPAMLLKIFERAARRMLEERGILAVDRWMRSTKWLIERRASGIVVLHDVELFAAVLYSGR